MKLKRLVAWCLAAVAAGCGSGPPLYPDMDQARLDAEVRLQREMALDRWTADVERLRVFYAPLLVAAEPYCGANMAFNYGWEYGNIFEWPREWQELVRDRYQVDEQPRIQALASGGAAERAGLQTGDVIVSVGGRKIKPNGYMRAYIEIAIKKKHAEDGSISVVLRRGEEHFTVTVVPDRTCQFGVHLARNDAVNAFANHEGVHISSGMMRFVKDDRDLAQILTHEIAHCILGHFAFVGSRSTPPASYRFLEAEADYVGLYLLALAGYSVEGAADMWRRMGVEYTETIQQTPASDHPTSPQRYLAVEATAREIVAKLAANEPLVPEFETHVNASSRRYAGVE